MIKRLKWNVLYGGGAGDESDFSEASDDSVELGSANAHAALSQLSKNDPELAATIGSSSQFSASDNSEGDEEEIDNSATVAQSKDADESDDEEAEYAEWRECTLCPGKRFLNDAEVEGHIASKRHQRAVRRSTRAETEKHPENPLKRTESLEGNAFSETDGVHKSDKKGKGAGKVSPAGRGADVGALHARNNESFSLAAAESDRSNGPSTEMEKKKLDKKKAATKRKLKALKRRKWEKRMQNESRGANGSKARDDHHEQVADCTEDHAPVKRKGPSLADGASLPKVDKDSRLNEEMISSSGRSSEAQTIPAFETANGHRRKLKRKVMDSEAKTMSKGDLNVGDEDSTLQERKRAGSRGILEEASPFRRNVKEAEDKIVVTRQTRSAKRTKSARKKETKKKKAKKS